MTESLTTQVVTKRVPTRARQQQDGKQDTSIEPALDAFPILKERLTQAAGSMSGGQQQMLALSRCFLADPTVVLLDEVSMGLAPRIIDQIFQALTSLRHTGVCPAIGRTRR